MEPEKKLENKNNGQEYQKAQPPVFEHKGKSIIHQGKEYIPAGEIAREFSYALSHVSLLARQQKIDAVWTGKRWYVNKDSVLQYRARLAGQQTVLLPRGEVLRGSVSASRQTVLSSSSNLWVNSSSETGEYLSRRANLLKAAVGLIALGGLLIFGASSVSLNRLEPKDSSRDGAVISFSFSRPSLSNLKKFIPEISVFDNLADKTFQLAQKLKDRALTPFTRTVIIREEVPVSQNIVGRPAALPTGQAKLPCLLAANPWSPRRRAKRRRVSTRRQYRHWDAKSSVKV